VVKENNLGYNVFLLKTLQDILSACRNTSIDIIVVKGAALLEDLYPDLNSRKLSDIDLLVKETDLSQIQDILHTLSFEPLHNSRTGFIKKGNLPVIVDLHVFLKHIPAISNNELWKKSRQTRIADTDTLSLSHEHALIYLSTHFIFSHEGNIEKWLIDIDLYVKKYLQEIDWKALETLIYKNNLQLPLYYLFGKIKAKYQTPFPPQFLNNLRPISEVTFQARLYKKMICEGKNIPFIEYLIPLLPKKGLINKLRMIFGSCFLPIAVMKNRYNTSNPLLITGLYILRPIILVTKGFVAFVFLLVRLIK